MIGWWLDDYSIKQIQMYLGLEVWNILKTFQV